MALRPLLEVLERVVLGAELGRLVLPVVDVLTVDVLTVDVLLVDVLVVDDELVVVLVIDVLLVDVPVGFPIEEVGLDRVAVDDVGVVLGCVAGAAMLVSAAVIVVVRAVVLAVVVGADVFAVSVCDMVRCAVAAAGGAGRALGDVVIGLMGSNVRPALPAAATLDSSPGTVTTTPAEGRDTDVTTDVTRAVAEPAAGFDGA